MSKEPKYEILESYDKIELRLYESFIVAEVECYGVRKEAIKSGFRILASYIFGNNTASTKLPMSIPVTQQKMDGGWKIRFMLTQASDLQELPKPNNEKINLFTVAPKKIAAIRFSGVADDERLKRYTAQLHEFADSHKWNLKDPPILAFYNPPWTLPFLRRNEILFELSK
jgi:hypothetical protein